LRIPVFELFSSCFQAQAQVKPATAQKIMIPTISQDDILQLKQGITTRSFVRSEKLKN
jgi:hypothetical protein